MAKKQTRRSISVSRTTYERLKAFCESNNISMSQLVETRVNDFLGPNDVAGSGAPITAPVGAVGLVGSRALPQMSPRAAISSGPSSGFANSPTSGPAPRPFDARASHSVVPGAPHPVASQAGQGHGQQAAAPASSAAHAGVPMTSAAARFAVEPPPPIIKPKQPDTNAPKPAEKRPDQIFTF